MTNLQRNPGTHTQPATYTDYRLVSGSRKTLHNILKFQNSKPIDPNKFTAPVRLHRKETSVEAAELFQELKPGENPSETALPGSASGADPSIIAPYGGASRNKQMLFKKRTKQVFPTDESSRKLKEQEAKPWVLEDYDGTNYWSGSLEGGQQSNYFLFVFSEDGFKVVPAHRWYRFQQKLSYATLTIEEAEEQLIKAQKKDSDRWMMRKRLLSKLDGDEAEGEERSVPRRLKVVDHEDINFSDDDDPSMKKMKRGNVSKHGDIEEVDFEEVFEDDEEAPPELEGDQEEIKEEQSRRKPNRTVASDDEEEEEEEEELTATGKEMKKALLTLEKNTAYDSDDEQNPYLSEEEEEEEEKEEKETDEDKKKQEAGDSLIAPKKEPILKPGLFTPKPVKPVAKISPTIRPSSPSSSVVDKKRKPEGIMNDAAKKARISSPIPRPAAGPTPAASDSNLITEEEIVELIKSNRLTTKDLITKIKKKLKADPRNKQLISTIVKKVATTKDGFLELK
ncbi:Rap30/74 interaction domain-containing protein [Basidiobolus meristosporus CBS 931.73]|uniref:Transcription initiation factor IIF subunit alpha n=1 Tax=Basidiobolus meristosporus CBS 931.73 TaxID=1314790 RepID=A0A1Y1YHC4_9FUNG|nr:Rap30/74 interaction domain-containing protein [Basidiobolus meristosporus CBS 931.73]|eukprot:ORX97273.1 Rap30/74 interaction domain-containing protein [Basidiobolus meristosporus CBS 931.73]